MHLRPTPLEGVFLLELDRKDDERGWFVRTFCRTELAAHGITAELVQCSVSYNRRRGTLRGLHYQAPPRGEGKLVGCARGALYDVVVDVRHGSPSLGRFAAFELAGDGRFGLWIPPGFAHGFQTLEDDTVVTYAMTEAYAPELARGIRWDDPSLGIPWPLRDPILSERDRALPLLETLRADRSHRFDREP